MRKIASPVLLLLLALLGIALFQLFPTSLRNSLRQSQLTALRENARQQRRGSDHKVIEWRVLEIEPKSTPGEAGATGNIVGGDFNGDGNQEVLFLPQEGPGIIFTPEGDAITTALNGAMLQPAGTWDYDLDGKQEIYRLTTLANGYAAAFDGGETFQTEMLSLDGAVIATLDGLAVNNPGLVFDYDGDSKADLALLTGPAEFTVYGAGGVVLSRMQTNGSGAGGHWPPLIKPLPAATGQPGGGYGKEDISGAACIADVDADGELDLVTLTGVLNLQSGQITRFKYASNLEPGHRPNLAPVVGDFFATGFRVAAVPTSLTDKKTVGVSIFDRAGSFVAVSEVGYTLLGLLTITSDGQDYLVVHAPGRIMVFP